MGRWYREPLLHFFLLGSLIFFLTHNEEPLRGEKQEIRVSLKQLRELSSSWREKREMPLSEKEFNQLVNTYVEREILYREALRLGLDRDEPLIKKILVDKMKYVASDNVDAVHLSNKELRHFFKTHKEQFSTPSKRITFSHLYFNPTKDVNYTEHANELFTKIKAQPYHEDMERLGNRFYGGSHFDNLTEKELTNYFSRIFIKEIFSLVPRKWSEPINSEFGRHIIYVEKIYTSKDVTFEEVKQRVKDAWLIDANYNAYKKLYERLRKEYDVIIEKDSDGE